MSERRRVRIEDGIAHITIDDGKVNALSAELLGEVGEALDAAVAILRAGAGLILRLLAFPRPVLTA